MGGEKEKINLGQIIRNARSKKGWSQRKLAKQMKVDSSLVSKWEKNARVPEGGNIIRLAQTLDIVSDLFPGYGKLEQTVEVPTELIDKLRQDVHQLQENTENLQKIVHLLLEKKYGNSEKILTKLANVISHKI